MVDIYAHACTDRSVREKPPLPALGPAGFAFHDPAFGTLMIRVTDATMGGSSYRVPSNAHLAAFNADTTKFVVCGQTATRVFAFDPAAGRVSVLTDLLPDPRVTTYRPHLEPRCDPQFPGLLTGVIDVASQCEPCWSRVDPNVLYAVGGSKGRTIQAITFDSDGSTVTTDLLDLDTLGLALEDPADPNSRTYVGGLITSDWDLVVFFGGTGQDKHCYVGQLPIGATAFSHLWDTREQGYLLHSVAAARSRQFITLYPTGAQPHQTVVIDTILGTFTPVTVSPGGHDALSYGYQVNADSGQQAWDAAQWQLRMLAAVDNRSDLITPVLEPKVVYLSEHSTWNNAVSDRMVPVVSSTFRFNNEAAPWRPLDDEVIAIATEGASTVWRFCHHRSDSRDEANSAGTYFWYQPIANVSPCGRWALVTSNWEKTLGPDPADPGRSRQDVFLVQLGTD
jgi:hypothetical protein